MELWELLGIRPGLTAVIGSGGKTSLLRVLAQELSHRGTVLVSTTTHIMRPDWCPFAATDAALRELLGSTAPYAPPGLPFYTLEGSVLDVPPLKAP